jgi:hypothetical protein
MLNNAAIAALLMMHIIEVYLPGRTMARVPSTGLPSQGS